MESGSHDNLTTADELWHQYPTRMRSIFEALDLQHPGLSSVEEALVNRDTVQAARALLEYYRSVDGSWVVGTLDPRSIPESQELGDLLVRDSVKIGLIKDRIPISGNGGYQWDYTGPDGDDEFGYSLNGHKYLPALFITWQQTGQTEYVGQFDKVIKDWVIQHPLPDPGDSIYMVLNGEGPDYRDLGEVEWRTLETGNRLGVSWTQLFFGFQEVAAFSEATRLLMLCSIVDQADFLRQYHKKGHNWTTMEMNGLALAGLAFPEFESAGDWADYALSVMETEINRQVYPDGVQTELSTKTQWVALHRFESLAVNFQKAGREIPQAYLNRVEEMYNYLALAMRPDGHQPLNNDSDREDLRPRVLKAAEKFNRPDWQWIATNGEEGIMPDSLPSVVFPWAGIHIMRSGWDHQAYWSFFDTGVFGTGHQHADKLHLSISAYGHDLLVDGGRYTHKDYFSFDPTIWRGYFRSSFSHNVILVDGKGQNGGPTMTDGALVAGKDFAHQPAFDYAHGVHTAGFEGLEGSVRHSRKVLYLHNKYWVVIDHVIPDGNRELQVLWHYAPESEVVVEDTEVVSVNRNRPNLRIIPVGNIPWNITMISGQEQPFIQGWYSADYNVKKPNSTAIYKTTANEPVTFAWLLVPAEEQVPRLTAEIENRQGALDIAVVEPKGKTSISIPQVGIPVLNILESD